MSLFCALVLLPLQYLWLIFSCNLQVAKSCEPGPRCLPRYREGAQMAVGQKLPGTPKDHGLLGGKMLSKLR